MKTSFPSLVFSVTVVVLFLCSISATAVNPVNLSEKIDPLNKSQGLLFSPEKDFEKQLNWRERIALKILKKKLKKRLKKGPGSIAFSFSQPEGNGCVTITLKNGQRFKAEIMSMSEEGAVLKMCDEPKGNEITMPWEVVKDISGGRENRSVIDEAYKYIYEEFEYEVPDYTNYDQCVWIHFTKDKREKARIVSTTDTSLVYVPCDSSDGQEFSVNKNEIRFVWARDGKYSYQNPNVSKNRGQSGKVDGLGLGAAILSFFGSVLFLGTTEIFALALIVVGFILGGISLIRALTNPNHHRVSPFAILAMIPGLLILLLLILWA